MKMSKIFLKSTVIPLTIGLIVMTIYTGCSDDKSPTGTGDTFDFIVTYGSSSYLLNLGDVPVHSIEDQQAVKISDLVDTTVITEPFNHAYRIVGSDGFYANVKGSPDNTWEHIQNGYILLSTMGVTFDAKLELINRYKIKDVAEIRILRKIDFITPADSLIQHIVDEMPSSAFEDSLTGVALTVFISEESLNTPESYDYELVAADDYSQTVTYEQLQKGVYVIEQDRVQYTDPEIDGSLKIKQLNRIIAQNPSE